MTVLSTSNLSRSYGSRRGVDDINLTLQKGEVFGFLGPNGAGKSTTIRLLLGFLRPSSGSASILGMDCWSRSHLIKRDVGYVAGDVRLYPWLTARRAFQIVSEIRGTPLHREGMQLAERFRLEPDLPVRKMSRGNRQKVALVLALVHRPKLVILDEPTSGLDPLMQATLADCLREMAVDGHSIFFSSHTLSEVEDLCDRVAIVKDGRIVEDSNLNRLKTQAPRIAKIRYCDADTAARCEPPPGIVVTRTTGAECELQLTGEAAELNRWAAEQQIEDISIGPPDLETLFHRWYDVANPLGEDS